MKQDQDRTRSLVREASFDDCVVFWCSRFLELGESMGSPYAKFVAGSENQPVQNFTITQAAIKANLLSAQQLPELCQAMWRILNSLDSFRFNWNHNHCYEGNRRIRPA
jgi:hypothetical protein